MMVPGFAPPGGAVVGYGPPVSYTYENRYSSGTDATSFTFSGCDIGPAVDGRFIVVGVSYETAAGTTAITSVTLDGNAMTEVAQVQPAGWTTVSALYYLPWDTVDVTGEIIVTTASANVFRLGVAIWRLYGDAPVKLLRHDTDSQTDTGTQPSVSMYAPPGSVVISQVTGAAWNATSDYASGVSLDSRTSAGGESSTTMLAGSVAATVGSALTITTTNLTSAKAMVAAVFR